MVSSPHDGKNSIELWTIENAGMGMMGQFEVLER